MHHELAGGRMQQGLRETSHGACVAHLQVCICLACLALRLGEVWKVPDSVGVFPAELTTPCHSCVGVLNFVYLDVNLHSQLPDSRKPMAFSNGP